ncbi:hypothetical protein BRC64_05750 [Halobacteriales archaeon QH_10_67_22]|nr:MAG: hypothetical protein BRC64_05750 [Halobacteriales archaeon QH_10_67_22]
MVGSRTVTAVLGLVASLLVTAALWWYFDTLAVFVLVLLVPLLFRRFGDDEPDIVQECPTCGFQGTSDAYDYCPRDRTPLEEPEE